ncbi:DNA helicase [Tanacetum coccineum]|uniref:DNA helicase n=1 Tax=Tanacetum coccineum TaxID=301880 RepID=A0ABQ5A8Z3_9ASTR
MSMNMYYAYQIYDRLNHYNLLPRGGRLFQQYVVTAYCAVEQSRLDYIRQNQSDIRNEYLSGLYDAILRGDHDSNDLGTRTVLTASFTDGPRIQEYMEAFPELTTADRADIVDRAFEQKLHDYIKFVRNTKPFGDITAVLYTIKFQKRCLPHCHSLLWISVSSKVKEDADVDKYISVELPDPVEDPDGYIIISELMMHGPCDLVNKNAPCIKNENKYNRNFPKPYSDKTYIDKDGFVHYRRRETEIETERQNVRLDNRYVVPYNRTLCLRYYAHVNVEYCGWTMLIKYLFKYIFKGTDRVVANITTPIGETASTSNVQNIQIDEIRNFVEARYIGPHEACWRIVEFPIHYRDPVVLRTSEHEKERVQRFLSWLLDIGDGNIGEPDETDIENLLPREFPTKSCIIDNDDVVNKLISFIYDEQTFQTPVAEDLQKKVIVCPKNKTEDTINSHVLSLLNHECRVYPSSDEATPHGNDGGETELLYPNEYLNTLKFAGLPPHALELKVGAPIILSQNLNLTSGLCNGTRMIITQLLDREPSEIQSKADKQKLVLFEPKIINLRDITLATQPIESKKKRKIMPKIESGPMLKTKVTKRLTDFAMKSPNDEGRTGHIICPFAGATLSLLFYPNLQFLVVSELAVSNGIRIGSFLWYPNLQFIVVSELAVSSGIRICSL